MPLEKYRATSNGVSAHLQRFLPERAAGASGSGGGRSDSGMWADSSATTISIVICAGVPCFSLVRFHHLHGSVVGPSPAAGGCAATAASDRNNRQCAALPSPLLVRWIRLQFYGKWCCFFIRQIDASMHFYLRNFQNNCIEMKSLFK